MLNCAVCGNLTGQLCGGCHVVPICGSKCQCLAWGGLHKAMCHGKIGFLGCILSRRCGVGMAAGDIDVSAAVPPKPEKLGKIDSGVVEGAKRIVMASLGNLERMLKPSAMFDMKKERDVDQKRIGDLKLAATLALANAVNDLKAVHEMLSGTSIDVGAITRKIEDVRQLASRLPTEIVSDVFILQIDSALALLQTLFGEHTAIIEKNKDDEDDEDYEDDVEEEDEEEEEEEDVVSTPKKKLTGSNVDKKRELGEVASTPFGREDLAEDRTAAKKKTKLITEGVTKYDLSLLDALRGACGRAIESIAKLLRPNIKYALGPVFEQVDLIMDSSSELEDVGADAKRMCTTEFAKFYARAAFTLYMSLSVLRKETNVVNYCIALDSPKYAKATIDVVDELRKSLVEIQKAFPSLDNPKLLSARLGESIASSGINLPTGAGPVTACIAVITKAFDAVMKDESALREVSAAVREALAKRAGSVHERSGVEKFVAQYMRNYSAPLNGSAEPATTTTTSASAATVAGRAKSVSEAVLDAARDAAETHEPIGKALDAYALAVEACAALAGKYIISLPADRLVEIAITDAEKSFAIQLNDCACGYAPSNDEVHVTAVFNMIISSICDTGYPISKLLLRMPVEVVTTFMDGLMARISDADGLMAEDVDAAEKEVTRAFGSVATAVNDANLSPASKQAAAEVTTATKSRVKTWHIAASVCAGIVTAAAAVTYMACSATSKSVLEVANVIRTATGVGAVDIPIPNADALVGYMFGPSVTFTAAPRTALEIANLCIHRAFGGQVVVFGNPDAWGFTLRSLSTDSNMAHAILKGIKPYIERYNSAAQAVASFREQISMSNVQAIFWSVRDAWSLWVTTKPLEWYESVKGIVVGLLGTLFSGFTGCVEYVINTLLRYVYSMRSGVVAPAPVSQGVVNGVSGVIVTFAVIGAVWGYRTYRRHKRTTSDIKKPTPKMRVLPLITIVPKPSIVPSKPQTPPPLVKSTGTPVTTTTTK